MTHLNDKRKYFDDIEVGGHYIIEHTDGSQMHCRIVRINNDTAHYYILEVRQKDGSWGPYTLSVPYHPPGEFTAKTISDGFLKVFALTTPTRRRRISR